MIDIAILNHVFMGLAMQGPQGSSLDPDGPNLSSYGYEQEALMLIVQRLTDQRHPSRENSKSKEWWFKHGLLVGLLVGASAARVETGSSRQIASLAWSQFDNI